MALDTVHVHADESCLGNQFRDRANPGGAAGLVELWRGGRWIRRDYWIAEPDTTNNRMAIRSAIDGLGLRTRACTVVVWERRQSPPSSQKVSCVSRAG